MRKENEEKREGTSGDEANRRTDGQTSHSSSRGAEGQVTFHSSLLPKRRRKKSSMSDRKMTYCKKCPQQDSQCLRIPSKCVLFQKLVEKVR